MSKSFNFFPVFFLCICMKAANAETLMPFADAHIHYNWDHAEIISVQAVVEKLKQEEVALALVSSTPSHLALELREAGGDWVIPFFSPYTHELGKRDWYLDKTVVEKAAKGLAQGLYFGIMEAF